MQTPLCYRQFQKHWAEVRGAAGQGAGGRGDTGPDLGETWPTSGGVGPPSEADEFAGVGCG